MSKRLAKDLLNGSMWQDVHGHERVRVVCPICNAVVGKALTAPGKQWLNKLGHPRPGAWGEYRRESISTKRVAAPNIASGTLLQGPGYPDRETWCEQDGVVLVIPMGGLFAAMARAVESGKVVRLAARRTAADGTSTLE